jgi:hypothetical protein
MKDFDPGARGPPRLSDALLQLAQAHSDRVTLDDTMGALGPRSFGGLMLILALVAMFLPPGAAAVTGALLITLSAQLLLGSARPWLPRRLRRLSLSRARTTKLLATLTPRVQRLEHALRPRLGRLCHPLHERAVAAACVGLSLVLMLPIPFAHTAAAFAIVAFAAGLMEADGCFLLAGWGFTLGCSVLMVVLISGTAHLISAL